MVATGQPDRLRAALDAVEDEISFVAFLRALGADWAAECDEEKATPSSPYGPGSRGWENGTIGQFLDSAAAWADASRDGLPLASYVPPTNIWRRCAQIIFMGKVYE